MELLEKEESTFLSLCSPHDRDLLTGRAEMTLQDFERITYLIMTLGFSVYAHNLHKQYMDFTIQLTEQIDRSMKYWQTTPITTLTNRYLRSARDGLMTSATISLLTNKSIIGIN
ncbi:hypothetical protein [Enterococcus innesii]|uniref:hypothetical protein n=1 Tax=Enterococcus innesii TaxID=2839759 RepID=UPI0034A411D2